MLNLGNIEQRPYEMEREAINSMRSYLFQLYIELDYRLEDLDRRIREIEEKQNEKN